MGILLDTIYIVNLILSIYGLSLKPSVFDKLLFVKS